MRRLTPRWAAVLGVTGLVIGLALALAPIHANGVNGNAISPRYGDFEIGFNSYRPMPDRYTTDDLRAAGVRMPTDAVSERRREVALVSSIGAVFLVGGFALRRRRHAP